MSNAIQSLGVSTPGADKRGSFWRRLWNQRYAQAMAIPGLIWLIIFAYLPMWGLVIAFKRYSLIRPLSEVPWVGLRFFIEFVTDEKFWGVLSNTLGISVLRLTFAFPLPIAFALFLNEMAGAVVKRTVQTISYLPHFISWVVLGGIMMDWLSESGFFTRLLLDIGLLEEPVAFLAEPEYFWGLVVVSDIWKELGWSAIIYLAAIAGIDPQLYEAATIDGAGRYRKMLHITLPSISGTIAILFILAVAYALNSNFDQIFVLRNALNRSASDVVDMYVYRMGIQQGRFAFATAVGLMRSMAALILLIGANFITKRLSGRSLY